MTNSKGTEGRGFIDVGVFMYGNGMEMEMELGCNWRLCNCIVL